MPNYNKKLQNTVLALGMFLFLAGLVLFFLPPIGELESYHFIINLFFLLVTALWVYFSLLAKNPVSFYISVNLCIFSLLVLILTANAVPITFKQYWPIIVVNCGVTLLPVGRIHYKKFRTLYVFPSASLTILGIFFMLFTFKIIKIPFSVFFRNFLPIFLILSGTFLIVLYYLRQNAKDKFPIIKEAEKFCYDDDDVYSEDDE